MLLRCEFSVTYVLSTLIYIIRLIGPLALRTPTGSPILPLAAERKTRTDATAAGDLTAKTRKGGTSRR